MKDGCLTRGEYKNGTRSVPTTMKRRNDCAPTNACYRGWKPLQQWNWGCEPGLGNVPIMEACRGTETPTYNRGW